MGQAEVSRIRQLVAGEKARGAVTAPNMNPDRMQGELKRASYLGVFNIENVVIDETGINFDFAGAYARRRNA